jgi:hypothetical protein
VVTIAVALCTLPAFAAPTAAIKKIKRFTVNEAQARSFRLFKPLQRLVYSSGQQIRATADNQLWSLSNGGVAIFGCQPTVSAMETWTKDMGGGDIYFMTCYCPEYDPNVDDGCKFEDSGNPNSPGKCGGNTCCKIVEGLIEADGTPILFK